MLLTMIVFSTGNLQAQDEEVCFGPNLVFINDIGSDTGELRYREGNDDFITDGSLSVTLNKVCGGADAKIELYAGSTNSADIIAGFRFGDSNVEFDSQGDIQLAGYNCGDDVTISLDFSTADVSNIVIVTGGVTTVVPGTYTHSQTDGLENVIIKYGSNGGTSGPAEGVYISAFELVDDSGAFSFSDDFSSYTVGDGDDELEEVYQASVYGEVVQLEEECPEDDVCYGPNLVFINDIGSDTGELRYREGNDDFITDGSLSVTLNKVCGGKDAKIELYAGSTASSNIIAGFRFGDSNVEFDSQGDIQLAAYNCGDDVTISLDFSTADVSNIVIETGGVTTVVPGAYTHSQTDGLENVIIKYGDNSGVVNPATTGVYISAFELVDDSGAFSFSDDFSGYTVGDSDDELEDVYHTSVYAEVVQLEDVTAPTPVCPAANVVVQIDPATGMGTLAANALAGGLSMDNPDASVTVVETSPQVQYTTADEGTQMVALTATDACGNSASVMCAVEVVVVTFTFLDEDGNGDQFGIADPCVCNDDQTANGAADGTFGETIQVFGPTGFDLVVGAGSTVADMIGVDLGDPIPEIGTTGVYEISFDHVDQVGYTIFISTIAGGVETSLDMSVSNVCQYPVITDPVLPVDIICNNGTPFAFDGSEVSEVSGLPGTVSVHVGSPTSGAITFFDPSAYADGIYDLFFVFEADFENNNIGSDPDPNPANPGCTTFTSAEIVVGDGGIAVCNNHINISIDGSCGFEALPDFFLEGGADAGLFTIDIVDADGESIDLTDVSDYLNQTLTYTATNDCNGDSCWGTVSFEDKLGPDAFTCEDVTINCIEYANDEIPSEPTILDADGVIVTDVNDLDNCGGVTLSYDDALVFSDNCGETVINRTYTATDDQGNTTTCSSTITVESISLIDDLGTIVLLPAQSVIVPCGTDLDPYSIAAVFDDVNTDDCPASDDCPADVIENNEGIAMAFPHYAAWGCNSSCSSKSDAHMQPIDNGVCTILATYSDTAIPLCEGSCDASIKVLRSWTLLDWCTSEQEVFNQIIESIDNDGPSISVSNATYSADPWTCLGSGELPTPSSLTDDCGGDALTYTIEGPADITIVSVNGNGNAPYAFIGASKGQHEFTYYAEDCCGNVGSTTMMISVIDDSQPSAISKQDIVLTLPASGVAKMFAASADNGSHDGACGPVRLEISKIGGSTCGVNSLQGSTDSDSQNRVGDCDLGGPILEGDFELGDANNDPAGDSRDPWRNSDLGGVVQITSSAFTGNWASKFPDDGSRIGYQEITLTPNSDYTINFFYFLDDPNIGTLTIDVLAGGGYDASQPVSSGTVLGSFSNGTSTSYSPGSITFNSGGNSIVSVYIHNEGVEAQVDDIELNCGGALADCLDGGPVLEGGFDLGDANNDPAGDSRDPWRNSDLGGVIQITSSSLVGEWAAKLPDDGTRIGYQELSVAANTDFTLDFFYFLDDADIGTMTVDILAGGGYGSGLPVSSGTVLGSFTDGSATSYTDASIAFNSGSNTTVSIYIHNAGVEAQIDEIALNCEGDTDTGGGDDNDDNDDEGEEDDNSDDDEEDDDDDNGGTGTGPQPQSEAAECVTFCCDDIDGTLFYTTSTGQVVFYNEYDVILGVWDDGNCDGIIGNEGDNYSETFATVRVEDKQPPVIDCPADATVGCTDDLLIHDSASAATSEELAILNSSNGTGIATASGTCGDLSVTYVDNVQEDECFDNYVVNRTWCVTGSSFCCTQTITVENETPFNPSTISWNTGFPNAEITLTCLDEAPMQEPTWSETVCDMIAWSVETDTFYVDSAESESACIKVLNNYTVVDWCTEEQYTFTQVIKVIDSNMPVIVATDAVLETDINCVADGLLCATATDIGDCESALLSWEILVDLESDFIYEYVYSSELPTNDDFYAEPTASGDELCIALPSLVNASKAQHSILWRATDGCGNTTTTTSSFSITDLISPVPYCFSVNTALAGPQGTEVWACDFIAGVDDNCSTVFRHTFRGPDEGFATPESTPGWIEAQQCEGDLFFCPSQGGDVRTVKIYTWDECNNYETCFVELSITGCTGHDNANPRIAGTVGTEFNEMVEDVHIRINSAQPEYPMSVFTDNNGAYLSEDHATMENYAVSAYKNDDHRNGVSTLDIIIIQRHILSIEPLTSPYQYISADANSDQVISAADLVDIRKLVLEIVDEFPDNSSWRFADAAQALTTGNAFAFNEVIDILALSADMDYENFVANKIGDVNGSVELSANGSTTEVRNGKTLNMNFTPEMIAEGISVSVTSDNFEDIAGYQFTLNTNGQELLSIESGAIQVNDSNIAVLDESTLTMSWSTIDAITVEDEVLFTLHFAGNDITALDNMTINSDATNAEAYNSELSVMDVINSGVIQSEFSLEQNEPNPFETKTVIEFTLPSEGSARLTIMDVTGRVVAQIYDTYPKGQNSVTINKSDLAVSGVLYYQLDSRGLSATKKMILLD
jgi:hypothetical protein